MYALAIVELKVSVELCLYMQGSGFVGYGVCKTLLFDGPVTAFNMRIGKLISLERFLGVEVLKLRYKYLYKILTR